MGIKLVLGAALGAIGCASEPPPVALENRVFYQYDDFGGGSLPARFEQLYPPLDKAAEGPHPEYVGVTVLGGTVHLSRPKSWVIRSASERPEGRFIQYISPNQVLFTIYERADSPADPWREVMARYEEDATRSGAQLIGTRVPMATWNAQGRAYLVKRRVRAAKFPFVNLSREYLARSEHRIDLVQIVFEGEDLAPLDDELLRVIETLEIL